MPLSKRINNLHLGGSNLASETAQNYTVTIFWLINIFHYSINSIFVLSLLDLQFVNADYSQVLQVVWSSVLYAIPICMESQDKPFHFQIW